MHLREPCGSLLAVLRLAERKTGIVRTSDLIPVSTQRDKGRPHAQLQFFI